MKKKPLKKAVSIIIVLIWAVMVGMLLKKHFIASAPVRLNEQYMNAYIEAREEWAGIYFTDKKIGYAHSTIERIEDGYQITEDVFLDMTIMNVPQRVETKMNSVATRDLALSIFSFRLNSGVISFSAYGNVDGDVMRLRVNSGGSNQYHKIKLKEIPVLSNSLKYYVLNHGLNKGTTMVRNFFDPMTMSNRSIKVEVVGEEIIEIHEKRYECFKIREDFGGVTMYTWLDARGDTIREESPMGLVLQKESKDEAQNAFWSEKPDLLAQTAVKVNKTFSKQGIKKLRVRLKNIDTAGFALNGGRQTLNGDVLEIKYEIIRAENTYVLPYSREDLKDELKAGPFVQSDRREIISLKDVILGGETDARKAVGKLMRWVYDNIKKKPTMSIPNAVEVLKTMQGDCNEHAVLLTALCRAAGVPAGICAGIVYLNGKFYYHAWVEVYLNGWVSVDPTMKQFPADVTHIKFTEGGMQKQLMVLRLIGKLEIEILEYR